MVAAVSGQELQGEDVTREDHPLSLDHGSRWHTYFKDNEIIQQVRKEGPAQPIYIYMPVLRRQDCKWHTPMSGSIQGKKSLVWGGFYST